MIVGANAQADVYSKGARQVASSVGRRILRWVVGATVTLGLLVTVATVQPSIEQFLTAAAQATASLRYDRALDWYARAEVAVPGDPRPLCAAAAYGMLFAGSYDTHLHALDRNTGAAR
jgi:outer membrane protein assembly factor BamB